MIELEPKNASVWYYKAIILFDKRESIPSIGEQGVQSKYADISEEIIQDIDKAIELDPENTAFLDAKGSLLRGMGKDEEAIEAYDKIIELDPQNAAAWEDKGYALNQIGRSDDTGMGSLCSGILGELKKSIDFQILNKFQNTCILLLKNSLLLV